MFLTNVFASNQYFDELIHRNGQNCVQRNGQNDDVKVLNLSSKDDYASPQQPYVATTLSYSHSVRSTTTFVIAAFQLSSAKGGCLKTRKIAEF